MRKLFFIGLIKFVSVASYSQVNTKNISLELRYPIPIGNNFINKGFDNGYLGLFDLGLDYNLLKYNRLGIGVVFNSSVLRSSENDLTLLILSPKIKIDYILDLNKVAIIPQIGIGYSNWRFRGLEKTYTDDYGNLVQGVKYKQNENGLTLKTATKLVINNDKRLKWYFNLSYEFTKLEKLKQQGADVKYNRNIHLIYPGIGMIWNFGQ